jgi:hypothetical protein
MNQSSSGEGGSRNCSWFPHSCVSPAHTLLDLYRTKKNQSIESFDVKKELKRILRGHHLPESHPEKPRGFLEQTLARIQATVVTELATLPGYTVRMDNLVPGAVLLAVVVVPSVDMTYYWLGAANRVRQSRNCV